MGWCFFAGVPLALAGGQLLELTLAANSPAGLSYAWFAVYLCWSLALVLGPVLELFPLKKSRNPWAVGLLLVVLCAYTIGASVFLFGRYDLWRDREEGYRWGYAQGVADARAGALNTYRNFSALPPEVRNTFDFGHYQFWAAGYDAGYASIPND